MKEIFYKSKNDKYPGCSIDELTDKEFEKFKRGFDFKIANGTKYKILHDFSDGKLILSCSTGLISSSKPCGHETFKKVFKELLDKANIKLRDYESVEGPELDFGYDRAKYTIKTIDGEPIFSSVQYGDLMNTFKEAIKSGVTNFDSANLTNLKLADFKLKNLTLNGALFNKSNLKNIDFFGSSINSSDFSDSIIENVSFKGVPAKKTCFNRVKFKNVDFSLMNLTDGSLAVSEFSDSTFKETKLDGVDFDYIEIFEDNQKNVEFIKALRNHKLSRKIKVINNYKEISTEDIAGILKIQENSFEAKKYSKQIKVHEALIEEVNNIQNIEKLEKLKKKVFEQIEVSGTDIFKTSQLLDVKAYFSIEKKINNLNTLSNTIKNKGFGPKVTGFIKKTLGK